jgi:hypothetical protein
MVGLERNTVDFSIATQEFLQRHGLSSEPDTNTAERRPLRAVNFAAGGCNETATPTHGGGGRQPARRIEQQLAARRGHTGAKTGNVQYPVMGSPQLRPTGRLPTQPAEISNRVLDITAIRLQPKLL